MIIIVLYDLYYQINIEHSKIKGINETLPVRYMFCDLNPLYFGSIFKEASLKVLSLGTYYFKFRVNESFLEF